MEAIFTDVCTDAEHLPDHGVCDVVTQVDQRVQHFLIRIEIAPPAATCRRRDCACVRAWLAVRRDAVRREAG